MVHATCLAAIGSCAIAAMSHIFGCKQTPPTPPTTSDEESSGSTSDAEMKKKKGNRAMGKKKYPKAVKYYTKAIKIDPENATYHLNRAIANAALELWKDAEADAATAVELQEDQPSSKSHFQLARARFRRGRCLEAREALKMGLERFPTEPALIKLGREIDTAVKALQQRRAEATANSHRRQILLRPRMAVMTGGDVTQTGGTRLTGNGLAGGGTDQRLISGLVILGSPTLQSRLREASPGIGRAPLRGMRVAIGDYNTSSRGVHSECRGQPSELFLRPELCSRDGHHGELRRLRVVARTLGRELQADFEHLSETQLGSDQYLTLILQVMEMKAGVQEDAEKRRLRDFTKASSFELDNLLKSRKMDVDYLALLLSRMDARIHKKRRTWKENKNYKAEMKKDRGSFVNIEHEDRRAKISRYRLCNKKGHWAEDCHLSWLRDGDYAATRSWTLERPKYYWDSGDGGGVPGVINFLVIQSNVPPLLSVGLLEHLGASFDMATNQISFEKIGVRLHRRRVTGPFLWRSGPEDTFLFRLRPPMSRAETRWKAFTSRIFLLMEMSRMMFCRLILAERGQMSIKSDRRSFLESSRQVPGACLHQTSVNRDNQFAKAKARGRASVSEGYPMEERTSPATTSRNTPPARSSHEDAAVNPALLGLSTAIQAMSVGIQQMSSAMRDIAQGQSLMLQMMTHAQAIPASEMDLKETGGPGSWLVHYPVAKDELWRNMVLVWHEVQDENILLVTNIVHGPFLGIFSLLKLIEIHGRMCLGSLDAASQVPADIFEAIGTQVEAGGTFSVKAGVDSQVWRSKAWEDLALRDKSLRVYTVCENGDFWFRVATDSYWMEETNGDNIPGAMERDLESYPVALEAEQRVRPHLLDSEDRIAKVRKESLVQKGERWSIVAYQTRSAKNLDRKARRKKKMIIQNLEIHDYIDNQHFGFFTRTLKAAGALPRVLKYVRDRFHFHCSLVTYAPTPQVESIMMFLQVGANPRHRFAFCDVKNAFCQSDRLRRPNGPRYALPCEGLPLPPGALIEIIAPVYGLDDAPAAWRATITRFLHQIGFVRNLIEPCWYMKYDKAGRNVAQVLVEVDDLIVSAEEGVKDTVKKQLCDRFVSGKWGEDAAEYAGRGVICHADHISVDQSKYILEQIHPIPLAKGRRKDGGPLSNEETRPELCGLASIMARTRTAAPIKIWRFDPDQMSFLAISDAGGINTKEEEVDAEGLPADATQGAWIVLASETLPVGAERVKASPLAWRINETDWLHIMYRDAYKHDVQRKDWRNSPSPHMVIMRGSCELGERQRQCSVNDAKSLLSLFDSFDCILKEHPQGRQDRKASLVLAIIVRDLEQTKSMVRWVPHQKMVVDSLSKVDPSKAYGAMEAFLKAGYLSLVDENKRRSRSASVARLVKEYQEEEAERRTVVAGPSGVKSLTDQARALVTAGNVESALPLLAEARSAARAAGTKREEINAASLQGKVELRLRRWADAVSTWQAVVSMETEEFSMDVAEERGALSNAQNNLGIALKSAQRLDEAASAFNEAYRLSTNGDDKVATYQAAQILQNASQCLLAQAKAKEARSFSA
ncbi:PP5, partial [Symbiodinium sp. KB8]